MSTQILPHPTQSLHRAAPTPRSAAGKWLTVLVVLGGFAMVAFASLTPAKAAQSQQHSWVGDVPIMAGLSVEPALGFAFDSPNGRIVMIFASSTAKAADIIGFYYR